jgi:Icc-related predicted phosphoesterase
MDSAIYLQDSGAEVEGIKFWGTPWTSSSHMAFSCKRDKLKTKWNLIPEDTDVLLSHLPPLNINDLAYSGSATAEPCEICSKSHKGRKHWGSVTLLERSLAVSPFLHIFGHVHEGFGFQQQQSKGPIFINAACDLYEKCIVVDVYPKLDCKKFQKSKVI